MVGSGLVTWLVLGRCSPLRAVVSVGPTTSVDIWPGGRVWVDAGRAERPIKAMSGRRAEHSGNFVQRPSCQAQHAPSNLSPASASSYPLAVGVVVVAANPQACRISADDQVRAVTLILPLAPMAVLQVQAVGFVPGIDDRLVAVIVEVDAEHAVVVASES